MRSIQADHSTSAKLSSPRNASSLLEVRGVLRLLHRTVSVFSEDAVLTVLAEPTDEELPKGEFVSEHVDCLTARRAIAPQGEQRCCRVQLTSWGVLQTVRHGVAVLVVHHNCIEHRRCSFLPNHSASVSWTLRPHFVTA